MSRAPRSTVPSIVLAAALVVLGPVSARALHPAGPNDPGPLQNSTDGVSFSLGASVGLVEGTGTELAFYYPFGEKSKLSELTWDIKDVTMASLHGSIGIGRRVRFNLGVSSALTEGDGTMVDRDWIYPDYVSAYMEQDSGNWSDQSRHPDTTLDEGTVVDVNLSVMAVEAGAFSLRGIAGYKHDTWRWSARGGTFIYSTEYFGSRDYAGSFPEGQEVIVYEQRFSIPYFGFGASWTTPAFQAESHVLFSPIVFASDTDHHVLRGVYFEGEFDGGIYLGLGLNATWAFARHWAATLGVEYQTIPEITGDVTVTGDEGYGFYGEGGGIALNAVKFALGAGYRY